MLWRIVVLCRQFWNLEKAKTSRTEQKTKWNVDKREYDLRKFQRGSKKFFVQILCNFLVFFLEKRTKDKVLRIREAYPAAGPKQSKKKTV